ncbi:CDP-archaeol synthase [Patescibacteria group bacterium]
MSEAMLFVIKTAWYFLPMPFANMMPVIFRRWCKWLAKPIDFNKKYLGEPLFGRNKTWRGFFVATLTGTLIFVIQKHAYVSWEFFRDISLFDYSTQTVWLGTLMGLGAMVGDLIKSYFKRRVKRKPGASWLPFDLFDYVIGGLLVSFVIYIPPYGIMVSAILLGTALEIGAVSVAKAIGIRRGYW